MLRIIPVANGNSMYLVKRDKEKKVAFTLEKNLYSPFNWIVKQKEQFLSNQDDPIEAAFYLAELVQDEFAFEMSADMYEQIPQYILEERAREKQLVWNAYGADDWEVKQRELQYLKALRII